MDPKVEQRLNQLVVLQAGAFARGQFLSAGGSDRQIASRLRRGVIGGAAPGVYVMAASKPSFQRSLWVAVLAVGPDARVSHQSAAASHVLTGFPDREVTVTIPHGRHQRLPGATVHQSRDLFLFPHHSTVKNGLPITTIERTIADLAPEVSRPKLEVVLDDAIAARQTSFGSMVRYLAELNRPGKRGMEKLRQVLEERGPGYVPPASELERMLYRTMEEHGEPPLVRQMPFPGRALPRGCVDGGDPEVLLIVELDGRRWHTRIRDVARDHFRDNEAARAGYQVLRLMYEDVDRDPRGSVQLIHDTREVRRRQLGRRSA